MYLTRQDHIDRQVTSVHRCTYHSPNRREMVVVFTNGEWACSSGHVSYDNLPSLRTPDLDPVEWIRAHAEEVIRSGFPLEVCLVHEDDGEEAEAWGQEGHLWKNSHHQILVLCMPRANKSLGSFQGW